MRRWMIVALVAVVVAGFAAYFILSDRATRAEENVRRIELLHASDGGSLAAEVYRLSVRDSEGERYKLGKSLSAELEAWEMEYQSALSETGAFAFIGRGAALDALADRRVELSERIEAFLATE